MLFQESANSNNLISLVQESNAQAVIYGFGGAEPTDKRTDNDGLLPKNNGNRCAGLGLNKQL
jgi:hypothetical protein